MHGIHVPIVTPFTAGGAIDVASLERLAHHILDEGAAGLVALGTTGEAQPLTGARDGVAGVKHCAGAIDADTLALLARGRNVLGGDDAFLYPVLQLGAAGGVVATANVAPGAMAAMADAVRAGDAERAQCLHEALLPLPEALFAEPSPSVIKAVLAERWSIAHAGVRAPLRAPATASVNAALDALKG